MDPLGYWRGNDAAGPPGHHRDPARRRATWPTGTNCAAGIPDMLIDTCACGGRRNDLETLRRAVPLLRSDYRFEPVGTQGHTYGMALWIPYYGTGVWPIERLRRPQPLVPLAGHRPATSRAGKGLDWTKYHRLVAELRKVADYFSGDYYPLTSYSLDNTVWMAWQFDRPELGEGMVQVFRRAESPYESARFRLRGLETGTPGTSSPIWIPGGRKNTPGMNCSTRGSKSRPNGGLAHGVALQESRAATVGVPG